MAHAKDINYQFATVPWSTFDGAWALPGGRFTRKRMIAEDYAKRINRLIMRSTRFYSFERGFNGYS